MLHMMKKTLLLMLAAGVICSCQQAPRPCIQVDVPIYTTTKVAPAKKKSKRVKKAAKPREITQVSMVTLTGPEAKEWDMFDRGDAVMKYNEMPLHHKEILFETIARVYANLPADNMLSSEAINTGIWKEVSDKGVDLSFGEDPADWHPYLMYIHPIAIAEMTSFYINAKAGSISNDELDQWQKAGCNLINAAPDNFCMAAMLTRRNELAEAGIIITETADGRYKAEARKMDWEQYRARPQQ